MGTRVRGPSGAPGPAPLTVTTARLMRQGSQVCPPREAFYTWHLALKTREETEAELLTLPSHVLPPFPPQLGGPSGSLRCFGRVEAQILGQSQGQDAGGVTLKPDIPQKSHGSSAPCRLPGAQCF